MLELIAENENIDIQFFNNKNLGIDFIKTTYDDTDNVYNDLLNEGYAITDENQKLSLTELGHAEYQLEKAKRNNSSNIVSLQIEKLVFEVDNLRKDFSDYGETKSRTKRNEVYVILSILLSLISLLIVILSKKFG